MTVLQQRRRAPTERERWVYEQWQQGRSQQDLAEECGITRQRVGALCKRVDRYLCDVWQDDIRDIRIRLTEELRRARRQAWLGWERSLQASESTRTVEGDGVADGKGTGKRTERTTSGQAGDANYLDVIGRLVEREAKLWGAEAAKKVEHSGPDGGPIPHAHLVGNLPADQLAALAAAYNSVDREGARITE